MIDSPKNVTGTDKAGAAKGTMEIITRNPIPISRNTPISGTTSKLEKKLISVKLLKL